MSYDVVIAGGSVMGCSTAYHLALKQPHLSIAVVERDLSYKRASAALSAGGVRQQFSSRTNVLMSLYGVEFVKNVATLLRVDDDIPDVQFREGGYLTLVDETSYDSLRKNWQMQNEAGAKMLFMNPSQLQERFPWMCVDDVAAGTFGQENEGWFDPWSFVNFLRKKCVSMGVHLIKGEVVECTSATPSRIDRVTVNANGDKQILGTGNFVNAAGAWADPLARLCGITNLPVRPRKRDIFVFHSPDRQISTGKYAAPLLIDPTGAYFRPEGTNGNFICGISPQAEDDFDSTSLTDLDHPSVSDFQHVLWPILATRVPSFERIKELNSWSGYYDYNTRDQNAIIGPHPEITNYYFQNGFSGHGLQHGPAAGRGIAELILDGGYQTLDLSRFGFNRILSDDAFFEEGIV